MSVVGTNKGKFLSLKTTTRYSILADDLNELDRTHLERLMKNTGKVQLIRPLIFQVEHPNQRYKLNVELLDNQVITHQPATGKGRIVIEQALVGGSKDCVQIYPGENTIAIGAYKSSAISGRKSGSGSNSRE